ncbi:chitin synthase-domain-containing protein [Phaeosphaeria sp. MPI-PUGE-AT-0046c]|nr:chitin synthase-domain-containing protein [Phaeosphaeria sp. MPI-PUGE-AT-0046c]
MASFLGAENRWLSARSSRSTLRTEPEHAVEIATPGGTALRTHDKLFACPYLKRDPDEYAERQSCSRSGWTTIHGLRQHVYRCHILPIKCPSCSQPFDSSRLFTRHLAETATCDLSLCEDDEPILGLESLIQKIKAPKANVADPSEEDMWRVLYTTLFPKDAKDNMPNPYVEQIYGSLNVVSRCQSDISLPLLRSPEAAHLPASSLRTSHFPNDTARTSAAASVTDRNSTPPGSSAGEYFGDWQAHNGQGQDRTGPNTPSQHTSRFDEGFTYSVGDASSTMNQTNSNRTSSQPEKSERKKLKKEMRKKTMEAQVLEFRAWEKPHRTDEHITPGAYRGFWIWLARCLTFYIPSWFLVKVLKMDDLRQRLAFRQKVLFCVILFAIYAVVSYFLIIQPILSCVIKVPIGMISQDTGFCSMVRVIIYVYMGLGGGFMVLVAICVCCVRYRNRSFEEHDALVVMQIPCYNEDEFTLRKTIESCVASSYEKKRKLLFIVADGLVAAEGEKPTYQILLEDIFDHKEDLELGIDGLAHEYLSFAEGGSSANKAHCATGFYRGVPYVVVIKTGRDDEQMSAKPGNRGKRDSQLLAYNFFHYVNYRRFWNPFFENLEFKMRTSLNMDARDAMYMLAIDCDTAVDKTGISYLIHQLQKSPKLLGVCGYTGVSNGMESYVANSQVFEYWLTHAVLKAVESICASVFVLSGCFTIYRLKWPNNRPAILHPLLLEDYAGTYDKTLHEHNLLSIGEDRYLSTLAIRYFGSDCRLRYFSAATCTTVVPTTMSVLLDQRRRWTNSLIHCHFAHLNVMPFEASWWTHTRMLFVLGCELFMVFILPLALPAGVALAVISLLLVPYAWAMLVAFILLPVFLCILCMDWTYIPFYLPFFPMIGMFSIVIPLFSVWNQDNIRWGKTRGG